MKKNAVRTLSVLGCAVAILSLGACSSGSAHHAGNDGAYRANLSPAMHSLGGRWTDRKNTHAYSNNTSIRALQNDVDNILHLNRPSRLHHNVKPY